MGKEEILSSLLLNANSNLKMWALDFEPKTHLAIFNAGLSALLSHGYSPSKFAELYFFFWPLVNSVDWHPWEWGRVGSVPARQARTRNRFGSAHVLASTLVVFKTRAVI